MNVSAFNASIRWLTRFKTRGNIASRNCWERRKLPTQTISDVLPEITHQYNPADIYNADISESTIVSYATTPMWWRRRVFLWIQEMQRPCQYEWKWRFSSSGWAKSLLGVSVGKVFQLATGQIRTLGWRWKFSPTASEFNREMCRKKIFLSWIIATPIR